MKSTKSYKIIALFVTMFVVLCCAVLVSGTINKVSAEKETTIKLSEDFYTESGELRKLIAGKQYTLSFVKDGEGELGYSIGSLYIETSEKYWTENSSEPDTIAIYDTGKTEVNIVRMNGDQEETVKTFEFDVVKSSDDTEAPKYKEIDLGDSEAELTKAYNEYKKEVQEKTQKEYTVKGKKVTKCIRLGDSYKIPTEFFKKAVYDDIGLYSDLSHTVYYKTPTTSSSTSSWEFTLTDAGEYEFFVVFSDEAENSMKKEDFYAIDEDDEYKIIEGKYIAYVFKFSIQDDAPMSVEASSSKQVDGTLDKQYIFSEFTFDSSNSQANYTLLYRPDENSEWIEIERVINVDEEDYEGEFTYEEITSFNYDGAYTFTPIKKGEYKLECTVSSTKSVKSATAESEVLKVNDKADVYKVNTHWLKNNAWSIVFLSVGTVCLIAVLVLIFVKPKEKVENVEEDE